MDKLSKIMQNISMTLIAAVIHKKKLKDTYTSPKNPYELALKFCLERIWFFLRQEKQTDKITHIVVESRGEKEDAELKFAFSQICNGDNYLKQIFTLKIIFSKKDANAAGLQIADLFARPIGRHFLDQKQKNRAYEIIETKFYRKKDKIHGLKCFP